VGRALALGLQRLSSEARAALATCQALWPSDSLPRANAAWLLRATAARAHLVRSRVLATAALLPAPEWADEVCPIHGVRH
jgi:hypothetical protein